jgi:putative oxidoreductase
MERQLGRFAPQIHAITRILAGIMFACHGAQKLFGAFGGAPAEAPPFVIWIAGPIELVGGLLIAAGLYTSYAAFLSSGLMAAAYFMAHATRGFWPIQNQGELAILYCWLFLGLAATGGGIWSADAAMGKKPAT